MSDQYAELRQAVLSLKRKYPELLYRPFDIVYRDSDGFLCTYFDEHQHPVGVIDADGRLSSHSSGLPIYMQSDGAILVSHVNRPDVVLGIVTAVDEDTRLATITLGP